ncbi:hypothetical protein [Ferrovibrio sp.]|uniref:hypothetical protein n=1 Tax=Ferrovibrio sp. TaxID=1917215 RepID=UPI00311FC55C
MIRKFCIWYLTRVAARDAWDSVPHLSALRCFAFECRHDPIRQAKLVLIGESYAAALENAVEG